MQGDRAPLDGPQEVSTTHAADPHPLPGPPTTAGATNSTAAPSAHREWVLLSIPKGLSCPHSWQSLAFE